MYLFLFKFSNPTMCNSEWFLTFPKKIQLGWNICISFAIHIVCNTVPYTIIRIWHLIKGYNIFEYYSFIRFPDARSPYISLHDDRPYRAVVFGSLTLARPERPTMQVDHAERCGRHYFNCRPTPFALSLLTSLSIARLRNKFGESRTSGRAHRWRARFESSQFTYHTSALPFWKRQVFLFFSRAHAQDMCTRA